MNGITMQSETPVSTPAKFDPRSNLTAPKWVKGQSGNPNGRPCIRKRQVERATSEFIDKMLAERERLALEAKNEQTRLAAQQMIINDVDGPLAQQVNVHKSLEYITYHEILYTWDQLEAVKLGPSLHNETLSDPNQEHSEAIDIEAGTGEVRAVTGSSEGQSP